VIVRAGFSPCVLDFGLARAIGAPSPDFPTLTRPGQVMGTATYMAPEQCRGERGDAHSDQYSFGLTTWQALHGALPDAPPFQHRQVPAALDAVLARMMTARAADRYATLADALDALAQVTLSESSPR
jgi:serine/threonine protein kinase